MRRGFARLFADRLEMIAYQQRTAARAKVVNFVSLKALGAEAAFEIAYVGHRKGV